MALVPALRASGRSTWRSRSTLNLEALSLTRKSEPLPRQLFILRNYSRDRRRQISGNSDSPRSESVRLPAARSVQRFHSSATIPTAHALKSIEDEQSQACYPVIHTQWPTPEYEARVQALSNPYFSFDTVSPQDLFNDEVYGEGGLAEQADWFSKQTSLLSFSGAASPDYLSWPSFVESLFQATAPDSKLQIQLDSMDPANSSASAYTLQQILAKMNEYGDRKSWLQLQNHLSVASRRYKRSKNVDQTHLANFQLLKALAYAHSGNITKAISGISEIMLTLEQKENAFLTSCLLSLLGVPMTPFEKTRHVQELVAAGFDKFYPTLDGKHQPASEPLQTAINEAFENVKIPADWLSARYEVEFAKSGPRKLPSDRMFRLGQALFFLRLQRQQPKQVLDLHDHMVDDIRIYPTRLMQWLWLEITKKGFHKEAWKVYSAYRQRQSHIPSSRILMQALKLASRLQDRDGCRSIFAEITQNDQQPNVRATRLVLNCLVTSGLEADVRDFLSRYYPNVVERLIKPDAEQVVDPNSSQNREVASALLQAATHAGNPETAEIWLDRMKTHNIPISRQDFQSLLSMYSRKGDSLNSNRIVRTMLEHKMDLNIASCTSLISLFTSKKDFASAQAVLNDLRQRKISLDPIAISSIINAAIEAGSWQGVTDIFDALDSEMQNHPAVGGIMLKALLLVGAPYDQLKTLFNRIYPDSSSASDRAWSILIQSACDAGKVEEGEALLEQLSANPSFRANPYMFTIMVAAHLRNGDLVAGRQIFDRMDQVGIPLTSISYSLVIRSLVKDPTVNRDAIHRFVQGLLVDQPWQQVDPKGRGKDLENILAPVLLDACRAGDVERVEEYLDTIVQGDYQPSITISTILLDTYRRAHYFEKMQLVWQHIFKLAIRLRAQQDPAGTSNLLCIPLSIYMDGLTTACRHGEIASVWKEVADAGFGFDAQNWNHRAVTLIRAGQPEKAFEIVESVLLVKSDQVKQRRTPALRPVMKTPSPVEEEVDKVEGEFQTDIAQRPPNRRHQYRQNTEDTLSDRETRIAVSELLQQWRPADITWRPTFLTVAVLDRAYAQLENGVPVMALLSGEEEDVDG